MDSFHKKPKHIGIAAITAEGAALAYRTICREAPKILGPHTHPEITLHSFSFSEQLDFKEDRVNRWAELLLASARKLADSGADFFICPANTNHEAYSKVQKQLPIPWLHIAEVVLDEIQRRGFSKVGVLGTKYLMEGPVYRELCEARGLAYLIPPKSLCDKISSIIYEELVPGIVTLKSKELLITAIEALRATGADSVILGCTELPLILKDGDGPLPLFDSTFLLALGALAKSTSTPMAELTKHPEKREA